LLTTAARSPAQVAISPRVAHPSSAGDANFSNNGGWAKAKAAEIAFSIVEVLPIRERDAKQGNPNQPWGYLG
jgi:hypothetical protein